MQYRDLGTRLTPGELNLDPSPQAFLSAVGCLERLWDNGIEVCQDFWRKTIGCYTKQPIESPGNQALTKKPEDSGIERVTGLPKFHPVHLVGLNQNERLLFLLKEIIANQDFP